MERRKDGCVAGSKRREEGGEEERRNKNKVEGK